jgi:hypothetical protein
MTSASFSAPRAWFPLRLHVSAFALSIEVSSDIFPASSGSSRGLRYGVTISLMFQG